MSLKTTSPNNTSHRLKTPARIFNRNPFNRNILAAFILIFAIVGGYAILKSNAVSPNTANLWVDTNGGSCTRQASAGAYNDAQACSSFQAAYTAASCGDTVGVIAGTYASQSVSSGSKTCTSTTPVTITSVPGGTCTDNTVVGMPSLSSSVSYLTVSCVNANASSTTSCGGVAGASGQHGNIVWNTWDHVDAHCAFFDSDHMRMNYVNWGPDNTCQNAQEDMIVFRANSSTILDVAFDHNVFKTVTAPPDFQCGVGEHVDTLQGYGLALTITNSIIYGCPGQCIILRPFSGGVPGPIKFENNFVNQAQDPGQAINFGSSTSADGDACAASSQILIQNNTFANGAALHGGFWSGNCTVTFRNNIFTSSSCNFGGSYDTYSYNVFTSGTACGSNAKSCTPSYVASTSSTTLPGDFHLTSGDTCAKGAADPLNFSLTDIDGDSRPQGSLADAGFDEFGSGGGGGDSTPPTASMTAPAGGANLTGSVTVSANASDNVGVSGVQFKLDGVDLGAEDTSSPYSISWDSSTATNGAHTLTATARDAAGNTTTSAGVSVTTSNASTCNQSSLTWQNSSIASQSGSFTFDFDATPNGTGVDAVTGLSNGPAGDFTSLAVIARFNTSGFIDAINGAGYASDVSVPYTSGTSYHFLLSVNVANHTYTIKVTPSGGSQVTLGTNYAFRAEQASVASLNNWALFSDVGTHNVCNALLSTVKQGDLNNDGSVSITDLSIMLSHYGQAASASQGDINSDGTCNITDLSILLSHYGT